MRGKRAVKGTYSIEPLKFPIRNRDRKFGGLFTDTVKALGIRPILAA
jgi:hypothetical protein